MACLVLTESELAPASGRDSGELLSNKLSEPLWR